MRGLDLPSSQNALIESAAELNPQTVVVLMSRCFAASLAG